MKRLATIIFSALLVCFISGGASSLSAQSATTGSLSGVVTDASEAVIPNVTVTLVNSAIGQSSAVVTGSDGAFEFNQLVPGAYGVTFSAEGFKPAQMPTVVVNASEAPVLNAILEPGAGETVTCQCMVKAGAATSTGTLVDSKTITSVPLTTRNLTQVLSMSAGSAAPVNNAATLGGGSQSSNVNGNTNAASFSFNGAYGSNTPNPDTIVSFKIQTSLYDAGYGALVPPTTIITKSGSNEFHGDLWEFNRNNKFNANDFFRKAVGQPKPDLKQNQFGGTLGGPIVKDRLFVFGSYQGTRQVNGLDPTSLSTMFLPPLTNDRSRATLGSQFCPAIHGAVYNTFAGGIQVDCAGLNVSQTALNILNAKLPDGSGYFVPTPQQILSNGLGFSSYSFPSTYGENQYLADVDYVISAKHTLSARAFGSRTLSYKTFGTSNTASPASPGGPQANTSNNYVATLKLTSVLTPNLVNDVRMDFTANRGIGLGPGIPTATSLGMRAVDPLFDEAPVMTINGHLGAFGFFGNGKNDFVGVVNTYQWVDNLSWVHGKQTFRTGVFYFKQLWDRMDTGPARGALSFQNFTDFLIGLDAGSNGSPNGFSNVRSAVANEGVGPRGEIRYPDRWYGASTFLEDDIKVTPRFTITSGVRWEYVSPTFEFAGKVGNTFPSLLALVPIPPVSGTYVGNTVAANYNPNLINPYTNMPLGPPPTGVFVRTTKTPYQNNTPLDTFSPRFGFAWQPGRNQGRVSVRGGYGWFYQANAQASGGNAPNTAQFTTQPFAQGFNDNDSSNSTSSLDKPFPVTTLGFQLRTPTSRLADRVAGPSYFVPLVQQWNLNTQFSFSNSLSLDVGYVGSVGDHILLQQMLNQPLVASPVHPVNCGYDGVPADCITTSTTQNAAKRAPILGELPTALGASSYIGNSWYHGMQATLRKQISKRFTFQLGYTYSKAENNAALYNDQTNLSIDWARATFDRTHRLIANYNYQLPSIGREGVLGSITKGWSMTGLFVIQSGTPMTLTDSNGGTVYGSAAPSSITLCPGATNASLRTSGRDQSRLNGWFNTAGICPAVPIGSDGSTAYGNGGLSTVNGPGQFNTDLSLAKESTVGGSRENGQLTFRVEFYNAFNHPQFSNPGTVFGTASFGKVTQAAVAPRLIQFGLKYSF